MLADFTATLPQGPQGPTNAKNLKDSGKPLWHGYKLLAVVPHQSGYWFRSGDAPIIELAELWVWGPKSANGQRVESSFWLHSGATKGGSFVHLYTSGYGSASGYGYCKGSAAAYFALQSAGISFHDNSGKALHFDGTGLDSIEKALYAIGQALGHNRDMLYVVRF